MDNKFFCYNCGNYGHLYRNCHYPIISIGIIAMHITNINNIKFLLIKRKDTIGYTDFIRGKYNYNIKSLLSIIDLMTNEEKIRIINNDFEKLWNDLWVINITKPEHIREFNKASKKFNNIKKGFFYNKEFIKLENIIKLSKTNYKEQEWGFPKGKLEKNEKNIDCAIREFEEETNLKKENYELFDLKPIYEDYIGTDNKKYRHIYYFAKLNTTNLSISKENMFQNTEISDIKLFNYDISISKIRNYNIERKKVIESTLNIMKHIYSKKQHL